MAFNVDRKAEAPVLFYLLLTHQKTRMVVVLRITYTVIKADRRVIGTFNRVKSALSCIHKAQPGVSRIIEMLVISYLVFVPIRIVPALGGEHNTNSICTHLSSPYQSDERDWCDQYWFCRHVRLPPPWYHHANYTVDLFPCLSSWRKVYMRACCIHIK